jgi:hypothetical protein
MSPLPFYVPPMELPALRRTVQAHVVRGLSHWLNNLDKPGSHPFVTLYTFGLHRQVNQRYQLSIEPGNAKHIVNQFAGELEPWRAPARINTFLWALSVLQRYSADQQDFEAVLAKAYFYHHCVYQRNRDTRVFDMKQDDASKIPADIYKRLESTLADLQATLLAKDPMMPQHLRNIHATVIQYPESVHLLSDQEIALIIDGAEEHTKTMIVSEAAKKATAPRAKSLKNISVADL